MTSYLLNSAAKSYSPLGFLTSDENLYLEWFDELNKAVENGNVQIFKFDNGEVYFRYLEWDTDFFQIPTYRI
jgi:hypothetical protein